MTIAHLSPLIEFPLSVALFLAGVTSFFVVCLGAVALFRRRSLSYLLIFLALSVLLVRTGVAGLSLFGVISDAPHHSLEHGLDFVMGGLLLVAVYYARRIEQGMKGRTEE